MRCAMRLLAVCCFGLFAAIGCSGDDGDGGDGNGVDTTISDGGGRPVCVDRDGDGYGRYCGQNDCDDDDPDITDECTRCVMPAKDCPCEPGTRFVTCDPDDVRTTMNGVTGTVYCDDGARYCRDGAWTDCEILWQYATFVPD